MADLPQDSSNDILAQVVKKVEAIDTKVDEWTGGLKTLKWVISVLVAVMVVVLSAGITAWLATQKTLNEHTTLISLHTRAFETLADAEPGATEKQLQARIDLSEAETRNWIVDYLGRSPTQQVLREQVTSMRTAVQKLEAKVEALEESKQ